jgi:hypothetical protein
MLIAKNFLTHEPSYKSAIPPKFSVKADVADHGMAKRRPQRAEMLPGRDTSHSLKALPGRPESTLRQVRSRHARQKGLSTSWAISLQDLPMS